MTDLMVAPTLEDTSSNGDELLHLYCDCSPDVALCGTDVADAYDWGDDDCPEQPCVVCDDLADTLCPRCGL